MDATITKTDRAPKDATTFSLGQVSFDLAKAKDSYKTSDPLLIAAAQSHSFFKVEIDQPPADPTAVAMDQTDPHVNPAADHLSLYASQETIDAAAANDKAIREESGGVVVAPTDQPTVASAVQETSDVLGITPPDMVKE